jgi:hypothetical protein
MRIRGLLWAALTAGLLLAWAPSVSAHVKKPIGPLRLSFGWGDEPPVTGAKNFVEVGVTDAAGAPISDVHDLNVEVSFGDRRVVLPLDPAEESGEFRASLVPTRAGTYAFHITGTANGRAIDMSAGCSEKTFECVADATEIEFPAKDPSASQLADRLLRGLPRAEQRGVDKANDARGLALLAVALAAIALATSIWLALRRARKTV